MQLPRACAGRRHNTTHNLAPLPSASYGAIAHPTPSHALRSAPRRRCRPQSARPALRGVQPVGSDGGHQHRPPACGARTRHAHRSPQIQSLVRARSAVPGATLERSNAGSGSGSGSGRDGCGGFRSGETALCTAMRSSPGPRTGQAESRARQGHRSPRAPGNAAESRRIAIAAAAADRAPCCCPRAAGRRTRCAVCGRSAHHGVSPPPPRPAAWRRNAGSNRNIATYRPGAARDWLAE